MRKSEGKEANLCCGGHFLMENRNGQGFVVLFMIRQLS
jgi:hypothetical protein